MVKLELNELIEYFDKSIKEGKYIPEFSEEKKEKINIYYNLIGKFAYAHIYYDILSDELIYEVLEPELSKEENLILNKIKDAIIKDIYLDPESYLNKEPKYVLLYKLVEILKKWKIKLPKEEITKFYYYLWRDTLGLEKIEPLFHDPFIEDISCDGYDLPVYIHHSKLGTLKTNIYFGKEELDRFIIKLSQKAGRAISYAEPLLDATLPDGSRVNATYSKDITTRGPTFTIRKFTEQKLSIIDLIKMNTIDVDIAAYLWTLVESRANILIAGPTSSGKTTLLNAISQFIPPESKVISIEDTREIQLYTNNWIPAVTRKGFLIGDRYYGEVSMYDLLKESMRQNPDYVIVGEVRGEEAYVMFQGMASGHAALSTIHADSWRALVKRLTTPPIKLSYDQLSLLELALFMVRARNIAPSARRVREVLEVGKYKNNVVETKTTIKWDPINDKFEKRDLFSLIGEDLLTRSGRVSSLNESFNEKKKVIEYMVNNDIRDPKKVSEIIKMYYLDKDLLLENMGEKKKKKK